MRDRPTCGLTARCQSVPRSPGILFIVKTVVSWVSCKPGSGACSVDHEKIQRSDEQLVWSPGRLCCPCCSQAIGLHTCEKTQRKPSLLALPLHERGSLNIVDKWWRMSFEKLTCSLLLLWILKSSMSALLSRLDDGQIMKPKDSPECGHTGSIDVSA